MHMLCQLDRHQPSECQVWNDGHFFSFCARCGMDLVRRPGNRWRSVRAPQKVVWKPRQPFDMPWRPEGMPFVPSDAVPVTAEWRTLIDRSRQAANDTPPRALRWADEFPPVPIVSPVCPAAT